MNKESVIARKVEPCDWEKPGDYFFAADMKSLFIWLPGEDGRRNLEIGEPRKGPDGRWKWDGNETNPTLTPSILTKDWHGYLTNGKLVSC